MARRYGNWAGLETQSSLGYMGEWEIRVKWIGKMVDFFFLETSTLVPSSSQPLHGDKILLRS